MSYNARLGFVTLSLVLACTAAGAQTTTPLPAAPAFEPLYGPAPQPSRPAPRPAATPVAPSKPVPVAQIPAPALPTPPARTVVAPKPSTIVASVAPNSVAPTLAAAPPATEPRLLAALAAAANPSGEASKSDFATCDGRMQPGKQDDGMRGDASRSPYDVIREDDVGIVGACSRALVSDRLLATQTLRRAHLLRARAAAFLRGGDTRRALADIGSAEAATAELSHDPLFRRSMGVSLALLRAMALVRSGDAAAALPLAQAAMAARPYALQVQQLGARIVQLARPTASDAASSWQGVLRLAPDARQAALIEEAEAGNFRGVVALGDGVRFATPAGPLRPHALTGRLPEAVGVVVGGAASLHIAYARAATGDAAGARRDLADVRQRIAAARPLSAATKAVDSTVLPFAVFDRYVATRARLVEARIAVAENRPTEAFDLLSGSKLPRDAETLDLLEAFTAAAPQESPYASALDIVRQDVRDAQLAGLADLARNALIAPETPRALVDYDRARPNILGALIGGALSMGTTLLNGIERTDGFRSTTNPDGTTKVEFIGATPSAPAVQEMTLLRAAEIARAAGKPAFVIVERRDYARRLTTTRAGVEISSVATGFKSELTIRPVDGGADRDRALNTTTVIDALGPIYYQVKTASR